MSSHAQQDSAAVRRSTRPMTPRHPSVCRCYRCAATLGRPQRRVAPHRTFTDEQHVAFGRLEGERDHARVIVDKLADGDASVVCVDFRESVTAEYSVAPDGTVTVQS